jgi:hypothetical protein
VHAYHDAEIDLCQQIHRDANCAELAVRASLSADIGVVILHRGRPVGRWRHVRGQLRYFSIISTDPFAVVAGVDNALRTTVAMARDSSWRTPMGAMIEQPLSRTGE